MVPVKSTRVDGADAVAMMFNITPLCCDKFEAGRYMKRKGVLGGCDGPGVIWAAYLPEAKLLKAQR